MPGSGAQIGTCDRCGKPVRIDDARERVNGLWEHQECPTVSLRVPEPPDAA